MRNQDQSIAETSTLTHDVLTMNNVRKGYTSTVKTKNDAETMTNENRDAEYCDLQKNFITVTLTQRHLHAQSLVTQEKTISGAKILISA